MIRVRQIKIEVMSDDENTLLKAISKKIKVSSNRIKSYKIKKQSLDARNKNEIYYVYEVDVEIENENKILKNNHSKDIMLAPSEEYLFEVSGSINLNNRPIIVGSGPAGLFAAYLLAKHNYRPLIIERGEKIEDRIKSVNDFWEKDILNENSNVQFGEGGAGTFSDGKLNTLINDKYNRMKYAFEIFVDCGAPSEILYSYKPHIGTDVLRNVIKNMRDKIISMGGEFLYNSCLTNLEIKNGKLIGIEINNKNKIDCDTLILAIGHSSRDTFKMLIDNKINVEAKPFAVGIRVQHNQDMINESQYGNKYKDLLGSASYKLTYKASNGRGVYSFCMCPGGYVVNASSEKKHLAINGMSNHNRDSKVANSAIIVTIFPRDFGTNPMDGINYQIALESKAYKLGNGAIPTQLLRDFYRDKDSNTFKTVMPAFKGDYVFSNLNQLLPVEINESIKEAFIYFGKKIKGFDNEDAILAGIESRTSSPVRIIRDELFESNIKGIYPCGEGAGYAGGITSAALDGIKIAEAIARKYKPFM